MQTVESPQALSGVMKPEDKEKLQKKAAFSIIFRCVEEAGKMVMCDVLRVLYKHPSMSTKGGTRAVKDICLNKLGWTEDKLKKKLSICTEDQRYLNYDISKQSVSMSFAYKVMVEVCSNLYGWLSDECTSFIKVLKTYKNKICHKYDLQEENLAVELEHFYKLIKSIYQDVSEAFEVDMEVKLKDVETLLKQIQTQKCTLSDTMILCNDELALMIVSGRRELASRYPKLRVCSPLDWMNGKETEKFKLKLTIDCTVLTIEDSIREMKVENLLTTDAMILGRFKIPSVLLISGEIGSGKTSLCHYLLQDWQKKHCQVKRINNFDLVLLVDANKVKTSSLEDYLLEEFLINTGVSFKKGRIIPILKELDVLFIIDSYEASSKNLCAIVSEIFSNFIEKRIILMTRPEFKQVCANLIWEHHVGHLPVDICCMDDSRQMTFTLRLLKALKEETNEKKEQLHRYLDGNGRELGSHIKQPNTLGLLLMLWKKKTDILKGMTNASLFYNKLCHGYINMVKQHLAKPVEDFGNVKSTIIEAISKYAWKLLISGQHVLSDEIVVDFDNLCKTVAIPSDDVLSVLMLRTYDENVTPPSIKYSFISEGQLLYYAASYITKNLEKENKNIQSIYEKVKHLHNLEGFLLKLVGILSIYNKLNDVSVNAMFTVISQANFPSENYNLWWKFVNESRRNHQVCKIIAQERLPQVHWVLDAKNVVSGLKLLAHTPVKLKSVKIEIHSDTEPFHIPEFLRTMESLPGYLKNRTQQDPIEVELHFWRHDEIGDFGPSDKFVQTLHPWGRLNNFTGSLGEQEGGDEVLNIFQGIKTIRTRVTTPGVLKSLQRKLHNIAKTVRFIRLTLALPTQCNPNALTPLYFQGNLELNFLGVNDDCPQWVVSAVRRISGQRGCWRVCLQACSMRYVNLEWLILNLHGLILNKLTIGCVDELDEKSQKQLEKMVGFTINWLI
ncbi:uncharacterized protein LOC121861012 [Homarus americanus]|uniref:uncharacterized protein LOC121861012 n=1 Tax=Homarus americanus TaxID=6706 RepID=UPI001C44EB48|nr:uncharacterized protein LOC121861012 [Homarus americanus]